MDLTPLHLIVEKGSTFYDAARPFDLILHFLVALLRLLGFSV